MRAVGGSLSSLLEVDISAVTEKELGELAVIIESDGDVERRDASLVDKYPIGIGAFGQTSTGFAETKNKVKISPLKDAYSNDIDLVTEQHLSVLSYGLGRNATVQCRTITQPCSAVP